MVSGRESEAGQFENSVHLAEVTRVENQSLRKVRRGKPGMGYQSPSTMCKVSTWRAGLVWDIRAQAE